MKTILHAAIAAALCVTASAQTAYPMPKFTINPELIARMKQEQHKMPVIAAAGMPLQPTATTKPEPRRLSPRAMEEKAKIDLENLVAAQLEIIKKNEQAKRQQEKKNMAPFVTPELTERNRLHQERMRQWAIDEKARKEAEAQRNAEFAAKVAEHEERARINAEKRKNTPSRPDRPPEYYIIEAMQRESQWIQEAIDRNNRHCWDHR